MNALAFNETSLIVHTRSSITGPNKGKKPAYFCRTLRDLVLSVDVGSPPPPTLSPVQGSEG